MTRKRQNNSERPFEGKKVYFSGSIKGIIKHEATFATQLVQFMQVRGAQVLSEHVALSNKAEMFALLSRNAGVSIAGPEGNWQQIRRVDMDWVDQATHLVALVDGPSHGVGMEIERALLKPERGLPLTLVLCLIHEDNLPNLSSMVRGVSEPHFTLQTYRSLEEAQEKVNAFLKK